MLYSQRKWQESLAEQEASGHSFWTDEFNESFRHKVKNYVEHVLGTADALCEHARKVVLLDTGRPYLYASGFDSRRDFMEHLIYCAHDEVPDLIEALRIAVVYCHEEIRVLDYGVEHFDTYVQQTLAQHRISFDLINGQMCEKKSQELHSAVVEPALKLLSGRTGFQAVEKDYGNALREISEGHGADALTDAGTALQEMLRAVGCTGPTLGKQFQAAKDLQILGGTDNPLLSSIEQAMQWVAGTRNINSDAHTAAEVRLEEAWLMVHIVGALILRLAPAETA